MTTVLSPIVSEFETAEAAQAYDIWFRQQVTQSLNDTRPAIPHDAAIASVRASLNKLRNQTKHVANTVAA
jgi:hypothetical protein